MSARAAGRRENVRPTPRIAGGGYTDVSSGATLLNLISAVQNGLPKGGKGWTRL
jgi:hypothetical protein